MCYPFPAVNGSPVGGKVLISMLKANEMRFLAIAGTLKTERPSILEHYLLTVRTVYVLFEGPRHESEAWTVVVLSLCLPAARFSRFIDALGRRRGRRRRDDVESVDCSREGRRKGSSTSCGDSRFPPCGTGECGFARCRSLLLCMLHDIGSVVASCGSDESRARTSRLGSREFTRCSRNEGACMARGVC